MLNSLDLFSGIGGMSLGLRYVMKPVAFCEIDEFCQKILAKNFPIIDDIRTLKKSDVKGPIDCITAGFPCQGFSTLGLRTGLKQTQSSLFYELLRVIDLFKPPVLFLENVPDIINLGLTAISRELVCRGYRMRWCIASASDLGAPHVRRRWFCLCTRKRHPHLSPPKSKAFLVDWSKNKAPERMSLTDCALHKKRCAALGNAVVPDTVSRYCAVFCWIRPNRHPTCTCPSQESRFEAAAPCPPALSQTSERCFTGPLPDTE